MSRLEKTRATVRLFLEMLERAGRLAELPEGAARRPQEDPAQRRLPADRQFPDRHDHL